MEPVKVFYSYAHEDKTLREELGKHLSSLRYRGVCTDWHDGGIVAGEEWDDAIKSKLLSADFILLLISADFLSSSYIRSVELDQAMRRHQAKTARVIPVMLRPCRFTGELFSKLQGLPAGMEPVTTWQNQDEAWTSVVEGLETAFKKFRESAEARVTGAVVVGPSPAQVQRAQLTETSTEAFRGLGELMADPEVKAFVAEHQGELASADEKLQALVDYKNVHDRLHDLQFKCYNYIFQVGRRLEADIDWTLLVQPEKDLESITQALGEAAGQRSMADEDFAWLEQLREAGRQFAKACADLDAVSLKEAAKFLRTILEMRPTIFDTKLCAAARTLPLDDLRGALAAIRDKLLAGTVEGASDALASDAGRRFLAGVDALPELGAHLAKLTTEHTRWQVIAARLWSIDALIEQDPSVLREGWPDLRARLGKICDGNDVPWAVSILEEAAKLDTLLAAPQPADAKEAHRWQIRVRQAYTSCANEGGTRFYQVDLSLKRLCDQLRGVQAALAKILEELL